MAERKKVFRGDRLRLMRERFGYSQDDLEARLGFGEGQIYRYESGKSDPSNDVLRRIATELRVSTDYLLGLVDDTQGHLTPADLSDVELKVLDALRRGATTELLLLIAENSSN